MVADFIALLPRPAPSWTRSRSFRPRESRSPLVLIRAGSVDWSPASAHDSESLPPMAEDSADRGGRPYRRPHFATLEYRLWYLCAVRSEIPTLVLANGIAGRLRRRTRSCWSTMRRPP